MESQVAGVAMACGIGLARIQPSRSPGTTPLPGTAELRPTPAAHPRLLASSSSAAWSALLDGESQLSQHPDSAGLPALEVTGGKALARGELVGCAEDRFRQVTALVPDQLVRPGRGETVRGEERLRPQPVVLLCRVQHLSTVTWPQFGLIQTFLSAGCARASLAAVIRPYIVRSAVADDPARPDPTAGGGGWWPQLTPMPPEPAAAEAVVTWVSDPSEPTRWRTICDRPLARTYR
jgi:hypothetical protein